MPILRLTPFVSKELSIPTVSQHIKDLVRLLTRRTIDRHDEAHEKEEDAIRAKINESHRFGSFAEPRDRNVVKW